MCQIVQNLVYFSICVEGISLWIGSGWKGLTAGGRAEEELAESNVAEGSMGLGRRSLSLPLSPLFSSFSTRFLFAPSSTREPVHGLRRNWFWPLSFLFYDMLVRKWTVLCFFFTFLCRCWNTGQTSEHCFRWHLQSRGCHHRWADVTATSNALCGWLGC